MASGIEQRLASCRRIDELLDDTEMDHAYRLEKQLGLIERIGIENYTQPQT